MFCLAIKGTQKLVVIIIIIINYCTIFKSELVLKNALEDAHNFIYIYKDIYIFL